MEVDVPECREDGFIDCIPEVSFEIENEVDGENGDQLEPPRYGNRRRN